LECEVDKSDESCDFLFIHLPSFFFFTIFFPPYTSPEPPFLGSSKINGKSFLLISQGRPGLNYVIFNLLHMFTEHVFT